MLFISILVCEPPCRAVVRAAQEPVSLSALGDEGDRYDHGVFRF